MRQNIKTIERSEFDPHNLYGYVIAKNDFLTLIAIEYDFLMDGYCILVNEDITKMKTTSTTRHCSNIMRKEGLLKDIDLPEINIDSWQSVFRSIKKLDEFVIIEDEFDELFLIGPIVRINKQSVTIRHFDGVGQWQGLRNIRYEDITIVKFACRYIQYHRKYISEEKKQKKSR